MEVEQRVTRKRHEVVEVTYEDDIAMHRVVLEAFAKESSTKNEFYALIKYCFLIATESKLLGFEHNFIPVNRSFVAHLTSVCENWGTHMTDTEGSFVHYSDVEKSPLHAPKIAASRRPINNKLPGLARISEDRELEDSEMSDFIVTNEDDTANNTKPRTQKAAAEALTKTKNKDAVATVLNPPAPQRLYGAKDRYNSSRPELRHDTDGRSTHAPSLLSGFSFGEIGPEDSLSQARGNLYNRLSACSHLSRDWDGRCNTVDDYPHRNPGDSYRPATASFASNFQRTANDSFRSEVSDLSTYSKFSHRTEKERRDRRAAKSKATTPKVMTRCRPPTRRAAANSATTSELVRQKRVFDGRIEKKARLAADLKRAAKEMEAEVEQLRRARERHEAKIREREQRQA